MIPFAFQVQKAVEAASRFVQLAGGRIEIVRLMKLMYLAERRSLQERLHPIFGDHYVSMKHGPVVSEVYDLAKPAPQGSEDNVACWSQHLESSGIHVHLIDPAELCALSKNDVTIIDAIHEEWKDIDTWSMVEKLHKTLPEWKDPSGSSRPIDLKRLCAVLGFSSEEMDAVEERASVSHVWRH